MKLEDLIENHNNSYKVTALSFYAFKNLLIYLGESDENSTKEEKERTKEKDE